MRFIFRNIANRIISYRRAILYMDLARDKGCGQSKRNEAGEKEQ